MDPLTAGVITAIAEAVKEVAKARSAWWDSLSPEKKTQLADKYADIELRNIEFWEAIRRLTEGKGHHE